MGLIADIKDAGAKLPGFALKGAKEAGNWAWDHKGEIGFWLGTAALVASVPMTGGASGAAAGGLMASRAAVLGAKVASTGRAGSAAVSLARAGAGALNTAGASIRAGRVAAGRLPLGQGKQLGKVLESHDVVGKLGKVGLPIAIAGAGEQTVKAARGDGDARGLFMSYLGLVPLAGGLVKSLSRRSAAVQSARALDDVAAVERRIGKAVDSVTETSQQVPGARAVVEQAGSARHAATLAREQVQEVASAGTGLRDPGTLVSRLRHAKDQVSGAAQATGKLQSTVQPGAAEPLAAAREELEGATRLAEEVMPRVEAAAAASGRLTQRAAVAERASDVTARASAPIAVGNNLYSLLKANGANGGGPAVSTPLTAGSIAVTSLRMFLARNAR